MDKARFMVEFRKIIFGYENSQWPRPEIIDMVNSAWNRAEEVERCARVMIAHSRSLIPALRQIARIETPRYASKGEYVDEGDMRILFDWTMDHLRYYPDLSKLIDKRAGLEEDAELIKEELRLDLMEKLKKKFKDESIVEPNEEKKHQSFIRTIFSAQICNYLLHDNSMQVMLEGEKIWLGDRLIAKGSHLENRIIEFMNFEKGVESNIEAVKVIENIRKDAKVIGSKIESDIRLIIHRIEINIPLRGDCGSRAHE